jgi:very-short-patch-repair endonuclease
LASSATVPRTTARRRRDRDRLRQQVLEDHGWIIHRIWSTDWFRQPQKQLARVVEAIEGAKLQWSIRDRRSDKIKSKSDGARRDIQREWIEPVVPSSHSPMATPYVAADFTVPGNPEPHLLPREQIVEIVGRIVEIEGPIHRDEIARRVTRVCGYARTGRRIIDVVLAGLDLAERRGLVSKGGDFFQSAIDNVPTVRDRSNVLSQSLRKPEMLPPAEIRAAAIQVICGHLGASAEEVVIHASRALGFQSTSAQLRATIQAELDRLILEGLLERKASGGLGLRPAA